MYVDQLKLFDKLRKKRPKDDNLSDSYCVQRGNFVFPFHDLRGKIHFKKSIDSRRRGLRAGEMKLVHTFVTATILFEAAMPVVADAVDLNELYKRLGMFNLFPYASKAVSLFCKATRCPKNDFDLIAVFHFSSDILSS